MTVLIAVALTGCCGGGRRERGSSEIYAPASLVLTKGSAVPTRDGTYRPVTDEVWWSAADRRQLREQLEDALRVIENQRNNPAK